MKRRSIIKRRYIILLVLSIVFILYECNKQDESLELSKSYLKKEVEVDEVVIKDLNYYQQLNEDIEMLLILEDRNIPIMSNDEYFRLDINGDYDSLGTPYIDINSVSNNLIIMGHSSSKNDLMFTSLKRYLDKEYFMDNRLISLETKQEIKNYEIIGIMSVDLKGDNPYLNWYDTNYRNENELVKYVNEFKANSINKSDIELDKNDELITLVTCDRRYEDARLVILMKRI